VSPSSGRDTASLVLLVLALVGGLVELFYKPFGIAPLAFLAALIGIAISDRHRRLGLFTTGAITLCFLIGASYAVWNSNALY
jgi:hypothetical protein